jgi:endogenous inhibitor of DNA gyrase (YacG/DUF329 family)
MSPFEPLGLAWYQTRVVNCNFCGQVLPRRAFRDERAPGASFCSERCAERWLERAHGTAPDDGAEPSG